MKQVHNMHLWMVVDLLDLLDAQEILVAALGPSRVVELLDLLDTQEILVAALVPSSPKPDCNQGSLQGFHSSLLHRTQECNNQWSRPHLRKDQQAIQMRHS